MAVTFPTTLDSFTDRNSGDTISEDHVNDLQDAVELLEAKVGITSSAVTASIDYKVNNFFVAATHLFFAQATPPVGWTIDTAHKDNVLACKADSGVYSVVGANKGTFTISVANLPSHDHSGSTGTGTAAATSHTHTFTGATPQYGSSGTDGGYGTALSGSYTNLLSVSITAEAAHTHTVSTTVTVASQGGSDGLYRPKATVGVIATWS